MWLTCSPHLHSLNWVAAPDEWNDRKPVKNRLFQNKSGLHINYGKKKIICVMDSVSVRDYVTLNCASVIGPIVCHARPHLHRITFLDSLSGADMHPLWSARAGSSFDRRRDHSLLFQYLPGRLMHHHFRLLELKDTADPNAETRRRVNTGNSAPYSLQQILQVW